MTFISDLMMVISENNHGLQRFVKFPNGFLAVSGAFSTCFGFLGLWAKEFLEMDFTVACVFEIQRE